MDTRDSAEVTVFGKTGEVEWDVNVGEVLARPEVHRRFGGSNQGGIAPVPQVNSVLLFTNAAGANYGYGHDGWRPDGSYHYTGAGQKGDQRIAYMNKMLLDTPRPLRLFKEVDDGLYQYLGVFTRDEDEPWYPADARDIENELRRVVVFRLWPTEDAPRPKESSRTKAEEQCIPVESHQAEKYVSETKEGFTVAERREAELVKRYTAALEKIGREVTSRKILMPGDEPSLFIDLYDEERGELIEAKSSSLRNHMRLALGQILDYARYVEYRRLAVLVPSRPADDMVSLLEAHGVSCIYEESEGKFERAQVRSAPSTVA
ncbi:hypothetical protein ABT337_33500 [Saccharopolyspora hirsuta]|uniref:hypothetical protein n=1 Tax=Saccharopolyspora hirsuta TaxID=1837 RepID=UPI00332F2646